MEKNIVQLSSSKGYEQLMQVNEWGENVKKMEGAFGFKSD